MKMNFPIGPGPGRAGIAMSLPELDEHFKLKPGTCFGSIVNVDKGADRPKPFGNNTESGKKLYRVGEFRQYLQLKGKLQ